MHQQQRISRQKKCKGNLYAPFTTNSLNKVTYKAFLFLSIFLQTFFISCSPQQPKNTKNAENAAKRIEENLIPITKAGADSGAAQTVRARMAALGVPDMSVAVFDKGRILWAQSYGLKDKDPAQPVDTNTLFQAASISKPVTSVGAFKLMENNLLALDEDVNVKLRSWQVPASKYTATHKVTVRYIISHMAGLNVHGFAGYKPGEKLPTVTQILNGVPPANSSAVRVIAVPGTQEIYSGGGFTVLQLLMQEVSGQPFATLMKNLVLQPSGMRQSTFEQLLPSAMATRATKGYLENGEMVAGGYSLYPELAAAGLWTTPSDLARFMLQVGSSYRGENGILLPATARQMLTRVPGGGGLGFGLDGSGESFRFRHNGGNAGFSCYAVSFAEIGRGVVIMTNSDNGDPLMHEFVRAISRTYGWPPLWPGE